VLLVVLSSQWGVVVETIGLVVVVPTTGIVVTEVEIDWSLQSPWDAVAAARIVAITINFMVKVITDSSK
jgi:hypothetical protein